MPAINKLIAAVLKGHPITSVRFSTLPDELHAVRKTRDGKVTLQLGKTTIPAEVWMAKQTRRFRNFSPNTPGYLGPKSSTNANNVEVYSQKRGWVPLKSLPDKPQSPRKLPAKTVHRRPRKAAPPSPSRATTSALVQLGTTLQALGAQLVNSVVDCAVQRLLFTVQLIVYLINIVCVHGLRGVPLPLRRWVCTAKMVMCYC